VFENRVVKGIKRISGPQTEEEKEDWKILYNEELHNLYSTKYYSSSSMAIQPRVGPWPPLRVS
jgi:hypothetical protein